MIKKNLKRFLVIILTIMLVVINTSSALANPETSQPTDSNDETPLYAPDIDDYSEFEVIDLNADLGFDKGSEARGYIDDFYQKMEDNYDSNSKTIENISVADEFDTLLYNLANSVRGVWNAQKLHYFMDNDVWSSVEGKTVDEMNDIKESAIALISEHIEDSGLKTEETIINEEKPETPDPFAMFIDGIAGILFIGIKIIPAMLGYLLQLVMNGITGNDITIYNILFNDVDLTNINFFQRVSNDVSNASTINAIRDNVAIWYYSIRNLAAVVLAIILVYIGIRMAISTLAEEKAKYKTMFVDWATSLCLLFVLQFIMVATININDAFITVLKNASSDTTDLKNIEDELWNGVFQRNRLC